MAITLLFAAALPLRAEPPVEVMVLGAYHMANPGQDVHNVEAADVTTDEKQAELAAVSRALQGFAPTRIAVEDPSQRNDLSVPEYEEFQPADLREQRNETVQIGFRLAHDLGHDRVYGIDEKSEEIDYFPFGKLQSYVEEAGKQDELAAINEQAKAYVNTVGNLQSSGTVGDALRFMNQPALIDRMHRKWYYGMLEIGDTEQQPAALLNSRYYLRNARIFGKLAAITEPGDRVVVLFGSGHAYWLRHFVGETPGYELIEPNMYLRAAQ